MNKIPTAKEQLAKRIIKFPEYEDHDEMTDENIKKNVHKAMIEFAKLHVKEALKQASEKVKTEEVYNKDGNVYSFTSNTKTIVVKSSILNSYSTKLIK